VVYTLNAKDFERIAPDLAGRIQTPQGPKTATA